MTTILKANKTNEEFNEEKVLNSIRRAGIPKYLEQSVLNHVKSKLYEGISTAEIYQHIIEFLGATEHPYSKSAYSLKQSIMDLGPTGYPFEDYVSKLLNFYGYKTSLRQVIPGECITHEVDIIAQKEGKSFMIEAKFHNNPGTRSQIHVALYTQARFEDVKKRNNLFGAWLITNTKTTSEVKTYSNCKNIRVISWSYPDGESLRDMIEKSRLHPVTVLTTISNSQKKELLDNHIVLCRDIKENNSLLDVLFLGSALKERLLDEISYIVRLE